MTLTRYQVDHIAKLARLNLTSEESERFREQLSAILEYAAHLQELDTEDILPTFNVLDLIGELRQDVPRPGLPPEDLMANAPDVENGQFRVPPVLE